MLSSLCEGLAGSQAPRMYCWCMHGRAVAAGTLSPSRAEEQAGEATVSTIGPSRTNASFSSCDKFLYGFKGPPPAGRAGPGRSGPGRFRAGIAMRIGSS
jgi:hypothetical protein